MSTAFVMKGEPYAPPKRRPGKRCDKKRAYDTEREAILSAQKLAGKRTTSDTAALRIYHCPLCKKIHLTSDPVAYRSLIEAPVFEVGTAVGENIKYIVEQDWFISWVENRLTESDNPTLEAVLISDLLVRAVPTLKHVLTPEFISTFSMPRFTRHVDNLHAMPYEFSVQLYEAASDA